MSDTPETPQKRKYQCGIDAALDVIGGKWRALILYSLVDGTRRYSQIQKDTRRYKITPRMLTKELRELESSGLLTRKVYPEVPPRVEYTLTEKGRSIMPILDLLCEWGCEHLSDSVELAFDE